MTAAQARRMLQMRMLWMCSGINTPCAGVGIIQQSLAPYPTQNPRALPAQLIQRKSFGD